MAESLETKISVRQHGVNILTSSRESFTIFGETVPAVMSACQQWLAEEAEREQAKLNAEKEQRRKQWEELNKEFAGESAYRVFKRHGDGCWVHESSGDGIVQMTSDGFIGATCYEKGVWLYIDGQKDCCVTDEAEHLEDLLEEYGIVLAR